MFPCSLKQGSCSLVPYDIFPLFPKTPGRPSLVSNHISFYLFIHFCLIFKGGPVGTKNANFSCSKSQYFHQVDIFRRALKLNEESFPSVGRTCTSSYYRDIRKVFIPHLKFVKIRFLLPPF